MTHLDPDVLLDLSLDGLSPAAAADARAHVEGCPECAAAWSRVEEEQKALRRGLGRTPPAPAGLEARIVGAVRAQPLPVRGGTFRRFLAAAAVLLCAAGAWAYAHRTPPPTPRQAMLQQVRSSELMALGLEEER
jgi:anti-sigma factor RsiW